jgi:hypothetical protein
MVGAKIMKIDTGRPWIMRRGRNWNDFGHSNWREDGWWFFGYRVWVPQRKYFLLGLAWYLHSGSNNFFYSPERRRGLGRDGEIFP